MLRHDVVLANEGPRLAAGDASGAKGKRVGSVTGGEDDGGPAMPQVWRQRHETLHHPHPGATGIGPSKQAGRHQNVPEQQHEVARIFDQKDPQFPSALLGAQIDDTGSRRHLTRKRHGLTE